MKPYPVGSQVAVRVPVFGSIMVEVVLGSVVGFFTGPIPVLMIEVGRLDWPRLIFLPQCEVNRV